MGFKMKGWSAFTKKDAPLKRIVEDEGPSWGESDPDLIWPGEPVDPPNEAPVPRMQNVDKSKAFIGPLKEWQQDVMDNIQIPMTPGYNREGEVQAKKYGDNEPVFPEEEKLGPDFYKSGNEGEMGPWTDEEIAELNPHLQPTKGEDSVDTSESKIDKDEVAEDEVVEKQPMERAESVSAADDITVKDKGRWKQRRDLRRKLRDEGMSRKEARLAARRAVPKKKLSLGFLQKK